MRFYDREEQLETLREMRELSYNGYSRLTVVTGRRRIGKTTLIKEAYLDEKKKKKISFIIKIFEIKIFIDKIKSM